ncbi:tubby-related protein 4 [Thrips palmi]|uniref:Tubby-related protein 4 n=1 Tax=Thrips palmi TaxID=161013 RepID=A0A6P8YYB1_THRPL|nr:tubby-related protein 4 [Thrips palmi]
MNVHFERNSNAKCDCTILNLTWMGKVPDELPELQEEGWKLNRNNYYQEGWLASGNVRGIVGVTFTSSHCRKAADSPLRTNYNLRGHHSQVVLVKWNEPYQKLASCDSSGIIFVWIKYEGRWSVELINDRNTPVTNFAWSHDGRMALICYRDGFVLVGSVAGQRYWSSMLNIASTITCGVWTPDDQQVYFGTSSGQIIVMDVNGAMVSQVQIGGGHCITAMAWSCEKFKMDEGDDGDRSNMMHLDGRPYVVACAMDTGSILFLRRYDDPAPLHLQTGLQAPLYMEWSNAGELLAVAGWQANASLLRPGQPPRYKNTLKFYTDAGVLLFVIDIPCNRWPVTALTWGHNDKRLFVATGPQVHIAWVCRRIPSLSHLCRLRIHSALPRGEAQLSQLPLPNRMLHLISLLFAQTIRCCVPERCALREFVSKPPRGQVRLHCTMIRHGEETSMANSTTYTLYLEYLGGLVPLLKGKRTSKIRPEFVIFDPRHDIHAAADDARVGAQGPLSYMTHLPWGAAASEEDPETDSDTEDGGCVSPRLGRRRHHHPGHRGPGGRHFRNRYAPRNTPAELVYRDNLSEDDNLVQVTSNIWGTRFKVVGLMGEGMPAVLGQITYKTSLLHLQPRQMTLCMTELRDESSPPIIFGLAPPKVLNPKTRSSAATTARDSTQRPRPMPAGVPALARAESYTDDEFPQVAQLQVQGLQGQAQVETAQRTATPALQSPRIGVAPSSMVMSAVSAAAADHGVNVQRVKGHGPAAAAAMPSDMTFVDLDAPNMRIPVYSIPSELNKIADLADPDAILPDLIIPDVNIEDLNIPAFMDEPEPGDLDEQGAIGLNFIDDEVGEVRIGPVRSVSVGFLNEAAISLAPRKRLVLTRKGAAEDKEDAEAAEAVEAGEKEFDRERRSCSKSISMDAFPGSSKPNSSYYGPVLSSTQEDEDPASARGRRRSPVPPLPLPLARPADEGKREPRQQQPAEVPVEPLFVDVPPQNAPFPPFPADFTAEIDNDGDLESSETERSSPFAALVAAEVPLPSKKKTFFDLSPREMMNRMEWPRRKKKTKKAEAAKDAVDGPALEGDADADGARPSTSRQPHSTPSSPAASKKTPKRTLSSSPIRQRILNSPLLRRRRRNRSEADRDGDATSGDEAAGLMAAIGPQQFSTLESFQKAQLRQKLKQKKKAKGKDCAEEAVADDAAHPRQLQFIMHNKAPMWNENSQVYQLDFGGRVTQESAKNFQIEFLNKQVMQFGRIDANAYTLDFQYPFSALQAFAVALANITQRLK